MSLEDIFDDGGGDQRPPDGKVAQAQEVNYGLNTVTGSTLGSFGTLAILAEQNTASTDQAVSFLSNHGTTGLYAAGAVVALRAFITFMAASGKSRS